MRRTTKTMLTALAVGGALMVAPAVHAEATQNPGSPPAGHGMMGGSDMAGMMKMMGQMSGMMEACSKMMQSAATPPSPDPGQPRETPPPR